ncbi:MAG TPA: tetratricopeptide repeat protein [Terracidiphilus sp.]|nr:tetratricopeptide repeat protein [Terracidiphilus sp.]
MSKVVTTIQPESTLLRPGYVYGMAVLCLAAGLGIGYVFHDSQAKAPASQTQAQSPHGAGGHMHSLEELKQMAEKQIAPLKVQLKADPNNTALLLKVGAIYHATHQFKEAGEYYGKAAQVDPKNPAIRTKLASSLFRSGDADGAIQQLNDALVFAPTDANTLFNLGVIKFEAKQDAKGAVEAWQKLLKTNPQLTAKQKEQVNQLLAEAEMDVKQQHGKQGVGTK